MVNKGRLLAYGIFLTTWTLSICLLFQFSANNKLNTFHKKLFVPTEFDLPSNQIKAFRFIRYSPDKTKKPLFSVSFDNLLIENNNLGIFKSALHQVARISNLEFTTYQYPENSAELSETEQQDCLPHDFLCKNNIIEQVRAYADPLMDKSDGWRINLDITSANVSELVINDFSYKIFSENDLVLSIQSKRAIALYNSGGLTLRGHVTIKTDKKNVLESNHVVWDIDNNIFTVQGVYALNQNGTVKVGRDITLDHNLNEIIPKQTVKVCQEEAKCVAKL